ncbi:restriction endonuclease subunit S [Bacteroides thetaiotaomicron]|uniref:restriction endonuclease subunit S n=1 Tax=Bacteroides thetaiotaomicron TaxID=818 RepID=UPI001E487A38|nr:restriction endonuclease subunit S [Bacteroides thetaiotaomicron]MDC2173627.1 restriction endonuclease subunit S [Bacteroides thetaiotaomicron]MDC2189075.1 restriction endonuclease subunit S [Bacteroides thetaiotaomicron]
MTKDKLPSIKDGNVPKKYELCKEGDIAFADASEDTNEVAKVVEFYNLDGKKVVCGLHTIHGRNNNGQTAKGFLGYCFSSTVFHNQIRRIAQGTKIYSINTRNFSEVFVGLPSMNEQQKIATLLRLMDERIATQNKIIEDLKKLKSAIYQELFSNLQGEEKSLSELAEITKGQQVNGNQLSENGKYYVMNGGIMPSGYYDDYNTEAGTISISEGGNSCGYVQYNKSKFWSGGHCYTLHIKPTARISTLFLFHCLKWKEEDIMALRIGSGLPNIQKKDLSKVRIIVPTFDKQQQLIALLSTLQMKIEYEEMYTINLDKQKLHLLSQMFI